MMAVDTERATTLGSRLGTSGGLCLSVSSTSVGADRAPPSPTPSCGSSSSSSSSVSDGRGMGSLGLFQSTTQSSHTSTMASTTQATLTVSVHSRPASPQRDISNDDDVADDSSPSYPPSPLSPGDERQLYRRTPSPTAGTGSDSASRAFQAAEGSSKSPTFFREEMRSRSSSPRELKISEERRAEERVPPPAAHHVLPIEAQPSRLTNFSIDAILKASFGPKSRRDRKTGTLTKATSSASAAASSSATRALDVANLIGGGGATTQRHFSPHGIDHLVHGHKYLSQQQFNLKPAGKHTTGHFPGRTQGFVPYHPAHRRPTPPSPPAARSPPLHPSPSSSSSPYHPYQEPNTSAPSKSHIPRTHLYLENHHQQTHHHLHAHHQNHHHSRHHQQNPRSPGVTSSASSTASPAASPSGASSISSSSGGRSPTHKVSSSPGECGGSPGSGPRPSGVPGGGMGNGQTENTAAAGGMDPKDPLVWPAWVYCTRYSDRPSSGRRKRRATPANTTSELDDPFEGPRARKLKKEKEKKPVEKRPRTAFTNEQLARLKREFDENRYLTETRRQDLAKELGLNESQIKIWFQNKRAKMKKASGVRNGLAIQLMAQGLYNHSTVPLSDDPSNELPPSNPSNVPS